MKPMAYSDVWENRKKETWRKQVQLSFSKTELAQLDELAAIFAKEGTHRPGGWSWGYGKANRSETVKILVAEALERRKTKVVAAEEKPAKAAMKKSPR
jgi:hypothetical protein